MLLVLSYIYFIYIFTPLSGRAMDTHPHTYFSFASSNYLYLTFKYLMYHIPTSYLAVLHNSNTNNV